MNLASVFVLSVVILILAAATYGTYRIIVTRTYCSGCPSKEYCQRKNPVNCTIKKD